MTEEIYEDEQGFLGPLPVTSNQRRIAPEDFPTGPAVGERLPDVVLTDGSGGRVDLHADRDGSKAAVVFIRSAVW